MRFIGSAGKRCGMRSTMRMRTTLKRKSRYGESLRLRIRDDGRGIDPGIMEEGREGHYGLPGMRERASRIGGKLDVWSGNGTGTEVDLSIPGPIAYRTSRARSRIWPFRKKGGLSA